MEHSRETYNNSKKRNQETLSQIQALENEVVRLEQAIRDKKKRANCTRLFRDRCHRLAQRQQAYHAIMPSPLPWTMDKQRAPRLDATLTALEQHKTMDPQDIVDLLSKSLLTTLTQRVRQLELPSDTLTRPRLRDDPSESIQQALDGRRRETELIYEQCDRLESHASQLQKELRARVRKLYPDVQIQTTYVKAMRTEAESASAAAQRKAMENQVDLLQTEALMKEAAGNGTHPVNDDVRATVEKQRRIQEMMALSRANADRLQEQREKYDKEEAIWRRRLLERLDVDCKELRGSIKRKSDLFHRLPLTPESVLEEQRDSTRLEQIKSALHPYLRLSQYGVLDALGDVLARVKGSHDLLPEPDLRETFEAVAARWQQDLEQAGVDVEELETGQDAVDTLVNAVEAFKKHSGREQSEFVDRQEQLLGSHVRMLGQAERAMAEIVEAVDERKHIEEGTVGEDYAYGGRSLREWAAS